MYASLNDHLQVIRTLLEGGADVNVKNNVRNQMMMMMTMMMMMMLMMMMMMMMMMIVINGEDRE